MSAHGNCIKLALLLGDTGLPLWQCEMVKRLLAISHVRIVLVLRGRSEQRAYPARLLNGVTKISGWAEKKISGWEGNARDHIAASPLPENIPLLDISAAATRQIFESSEIDLLLDLPGDVPAADYFHATSTQQIWRYFYDETLALSPLRVSVREYAAGRNRLVSGLLSQHKSGTQQYLFWAKSGVNRPLFTQNVDQLLWKMADFIPFILRQSPTVDVLQQQVQQRHEHCVAQVTVPVRKQGKTVSNGIALRDLRRLVWRGLCRAGGKVSRRLWQYQHREQWILLLGNKDILNRAGGVNKLAHLQKIIPPPDRLWADPFLLHEAGRDYVFFEELVYKQGKGRLVCMELQADGSHDKPLVVLEKPYHLSYPFLFRYQGALYMMPESAQNRSLDLYRCEQFPQRWVKVKTMMADAEAYDATLYEDEQGCWWMFVCMRQHEYASTNELLYLFYADSPLSDQWQPHPCNPVVTDAATARPAGNLLHLNGRLYRPSQNCAASYGRGLNLNELVTLNKQEYFEQTSSQFIATGQSELDGVHTLNCLNDRVVSDGILLRKRHSYG
jgi:hypothetical protein